MSWVAGFVGLGWQTDWLWHSKSKQKSRSKFVFRPATRRLRPSSRTRSGKYRRPARCSFTRAETNRRRQCSDPACGFVLRIRPRRKCPALLRSGSGNRQGPPHRTADRNPHGLGPIYDPHCSAIRRISSCAGLVAIRYHDGPDDRSGTWSSATDEGGG